MLGNPRLRLFDVFNAVVPIVNDKIGIDPAVAHLTHQFPLDKLSYDGFNVRRRNTDGFCQFSHRHRLFICQHQQILCQNIVIPHKRHWLVIKPAATAVSQKHLFGFIAIFFIIVHRIKPLSHLFSSKIKAAFPGPDRNPEGGGNVTERLSVKIMPHYDDAVHLRKIRHLSPHCLRFIRFKSGIKHIGVIGNVKVLPDGDRRKSILSAQSVIESAVHDRQKPAAQIIDDAAFFLINQRRQQRVLRQVTRILCVAAFGKRTVK